MTRYIVRRLIAVVILVAIVSVLDFLIIHLVPGDPVAMMLGSNAASTEMIARVRAELGLNLPLYVQYWHWLAGVVHGDFGMSFVNQIPVTHLLLENYPSTLQLTLGALVVTVVFGIPLGIIAAVRHNEVWDTAVMVIALVGLAMPSFWLGLLLISVFGVELKWLPVFGGLTFKALILPSLALGIGGGGVVARYVRSNLLETINQQFVTVARSKGVTAAGVLFRHVLRNAILPVVTVIGLQVGNLLSGTVVVEIVFSRPGVGRLLVTSINDKDYPSVQAVILLFTVVYALTNLAVDMLYPVLDPRIKYA